MWMAGSHDRTAHRDEAEMTLSFKRMVHAVDSHTKGNPTRVVVGGVPVPPGATLAERTEWLKRNDDALRRLLNFEPRGNPMMCSVYVFPAIDPKADFSVVITEQDEYVPMSGHCIIGTATTVVATGMVPAREPETIVTFETLAGHVTCKVAVEGGRIGAVAFENVPSFLLLADVVVRREGRPDIAVDVAYGGCFYAIADADALGLELGPTNEAAIIAEARSLIQALNAQHRIAHPFVEGIERCYQTLFRSSRCGAGDVKQVIVAPPGALDRSPCGTGASAHLAALVAKGAARLGDELLFEGLMGTTFAAKVMESRTEAGLPVIVPQVRGRAFLTGFYQLVLDHDDPFPEGFRIGDPPRDQHRPGIWGSDR
jgi:proline racemase